MKKPVALIIMDGYGIADDSKGNAVSLAKKPNLDRLFKEFPHATLQASGEAVGLPEGQMGNSEVGHLNIGAGRIVYQSLSRINNAINDGSFFELEAFKKAIENVKKNNSKLHIFGLCSDGGVHSHTKHINALVDLAKKNNVKCYVHAFLDGRDVAPKSAEIYLKKIIDNGGIVSTVSGRYYAMDRDKNWNRTQQAYDVITGNTHNFFDNAYEGLKDSYESDILDEFVVPFATTKDGFVENGDSIIFSNFRPDRAIQIATAFSNPDAAGLDSSKGPRDICFVSMMKYADSVKGELAFDLLDLKNTYGDVISQNGLKQLRIAETEKYAHVTFFFDGGVDKEIEGSKRVLVKSPKVATYDLKPEMSAYEVTEKCINEINNDTPDTIILNFANCDMVGHTGVIEAAKKAVEVTDECVGRIVDAVNSIGGVCIITADHGNAERMLDENDKPYTAHTTNLVPVIVTDKSVKVKDGILADLAPTMLEYLEIEKPKEMTGNSIISK